MKSSKGNSFTDRPTQLFDHFVEKSRQPFFQTELFESYGINNIYHIHKSCCKYIVCMYWNINSNIENSIFISTRIREGVKKIVVADMSVNGK